MWRSVQLYFVGVGVRRAVLVCMWCVSLYVCVLVVQYIVSVKECDITVSTVSRIPYMVVRQ